MNLQARFFAEYRRSENVMAWRLAFAAKPRRCTLRDQVMRRKTRTPRQILLHFMIIAASAVTVLFALSTIFRFGGATNRRASPGWTGSSANADVVQVICFHGQFQLAINFAFHPKTGPMAESRGWHAGSLLPAVLISTSTCRRTPQAATAPTCFGMATVRDLT